MPLSTSDLREQQKQAEELLFSEQEKLGFAKSLFFGQYRSSLVWPYPDLKAEERAGVQPYWMPYFAVESLQTTVDRCHEHGGRKLYGPAELPAGRIAVLQDPQGATFAIWEGELED